MREESAWKRQAQLSRVPGVLLCCDHCSGRHMSVARQGVEAQHCGPLCREGRGCLDGGGRKPSTDSEGHPQSRLASVSLSRALPPPDPQPGLVLSLF